MQVDERGRGTDDSGENGTGEIGNEEKEDKRPEVMDWNQTIDNMFRLAMTINIPYELFWNITPYEMEIMVDAYKEQQKHANYMMWVNGIYAMSALSATVGNMFRKKNTEPNKYMEEPLPVFKERKELTEEEKLTEEQKLLLTLETMQKAFELNRR